MQGYYTVILVILTPTSTDKVLMKNVVIFFGLISTIQLAQAQSVKSFDLNRDGVQDRFEYTSKDKIIRIEEDRNGDKKIDFKTTLNDSTYYRIEEQDSDHDGKFDRKKSYQLLPKSKTRLITEIDKNADGKFEIRYEEVKNNIQDQAECDPLVVNKKIESLSRTVLKAVSKTDKGFLPTGLGYKVDYECYNKWGDDFNKIIKETVQGGLQCLMDLNKKSSPGSNITGALRNAFDLTKLYENDKVSLTCSETDFDWTGTRAHASTEASETLESKKIKHPFVSLNPAYPENEPGNREKEIADIRNTIFHETLHNLGYLHEEDIEYPYTCGLCCFDKDESEALREQSCKVCTGNYKNETDLNYIKDFLEFSHLNYQSERGAAAVVKYLKENPKNVSGVSMLAYAQSGAFNPVGPELAKIISAKHTTLTADDKSYLEKANLYGDSEEFKKLKGTSKALANTMYELYYNKSGANAIAQLEANKALIKSELAKIKSSDNYLYDDTKVVLDRIIFDMWINKYPEGDVEPNVTSDKAYDLYDYFQ